MECLAILNRLSIFSSDSEERAELCSALEKESETLVPADVPLSALDTAVLLLSDHVADAAIVRSVCNFIASCALGDSQVVRKHLIQIKAPANFNQASLERASDSLFIVSVINRALDSSVVSFIESTSSLGNWKSCIQPITDLIATLSYNNGTIRSAFGTDTLDLLCKILTRARTEEENTSQMVRTQNVLGSSSRTGRQAAASTGTFEPSSHPMVSLYYYTISCLAVLLMADGKNSSAALSLGVIAEVLHCYKCLNVASVAGPAGWRRPGSSTANPHVASRVGGSCDEFGPIVRFSFVTNESKAELNKWCVQVLRNAAIASPAHPVWEKGDTTNRPLEWGRMGEILAVDELKWEISKLRKKHMMSS